MSRRQVRGSEPGYIGLTCEAPIFTAVEKGFFKEEGLEVSLVKCEWANCKDVLALGMGWRRSVSRAGDILLVSFWGRFPWSVYALISGPLFLLGVLFLMNWRQRATLHARI